MLSNKLDAILTLKNSNISQFAKEFKISQANLSQKGERNSYYLKEAVMIAKYTNTRLAFVDENDKILISFEDEDIAPKGQ